MKIFVAGATGAVGKPLVSLLVERRFDVVGMTRSRRKTAALRDAGAEPVVADGLDRDAVIAAVVRAEPHAVVHEMTALAGVTSGVAVDFHYFQAFTVRGGRITASYATETRAEARQAVGLSE